MGNQLPIVDSWTVNDFRQSIIKVLRDRDILVYDACYINVEEIEEGEYLVEVKYPGAKLPVTTKIVFDIK